MAVRVDRMNVVNPLVAPKNRRRPDAPRPFSPVGGGQGGMMAGMGTGGDR